MTEAGADNVPSRLILSGEGLERMSAERYAIFIQKLGQMGISVEAAEGVPADEIYAAESVPADDAEAAMPEEAARVTREDIYSFATAYGYTESLAKTVWSGLRYTYAINRDRKLGVPGSFSSNDRYWLRRTEGCPIEFEENPAYAEQGALTPPNELESLKPESLHATVAWLFDKGGYSLPELPVFKCGKQSLAMLAHFVNETAQPEEPFPVKPQPRAQYDLIPEPIPPTEAFEADPESPYLDKVCVQGADVMVVSAGALRRFCMDIGLESKRSSRFGVIIHSMARRLSMGAAARVENESVRYENGLLRVFAEIPSSRYKARNRVEWMIEPEAFARVLREHQNGEFKIYGMSHFMFNVASKYMAAIRRQPEEQPDQPEPAGSPEDTIG